MTPATATAPAHHAYLRIEGWVPDDWSDCFEGIGVHHAADGSTILSGDLKDDAELFGILRCIESRGMKLIACVAYPGGAK